MGNVETSMNRLLIGPTMLPHDIGMYYALLFASRGEATSIDSGRAQPGLRPD